MEKIIYQFWTGSNQMSYDRQMAFNTNSNIKNVNIKLITPENINEYILNDLKSEGLLDRVMFGTDNPIDGLDTLNNQIYLDYYNNKIKLTKKELSKVYFENALKVYKIDKNLLKPRYFD